jgi:hypothetical protein
MVPAHLVPLDRVRQRFEHWRRTRRRRSPIPEALWALALEAASGNSDSAIKIFGKANRLIPLIF